MTPYCKVLPEKYICEKHSFWLYLSIKSYSNIVLTIYVTVQTVFFYSCGGNGLP